MAACDWVQEEWRRVCCDSGQLAIYPPIHFLWISKIAIENIMDQTPRSTYLYHEMIIQWTFDISNPDNSKCMVSLNLEDGGRISEIFFS